MKNYISFKESKLRKHFLNCCKAFTGFAMALALGGVLFCLAGQEVCAGSNQGVYAGSGQEVYAKVYTSSDKKIYTSSEQEERSLITFQDEESLKKAVESVSNIRRYWYTYDYYVDEDVAMNEPAAVLPDGAESSDMAESSDSKDTSGTYTQVQGVDEADTVKTDGKYIYYLSETSSNQIRIAKAGAKKAKTVSKINISYDKGRICDFYLYKDRLVLICDSYENLSGIRYSYRPLVKMFFYDISDPANPTKLGVYRQDGSYRSSRLTGGRVILVSNMGVYRSYRDDFIYHPMATWDGAYQNLPLSDIYALPEASSAEFAVVASVDAESGMKGAKEVKAVLGGGDEIYCNTENLYITATKYSYYPFFSLDPVLPTDTDGGQAAETTTGGGVEAADPTQTGSTGVSVPAGSAGEPTAAVTTGGGLAPVAVTGSAMIPVERVPVVAWGRDKTYTRILRVSLADGSLDFTGWAKADGYVNNQFSMDEKDGHLRIALTSENKQGKDINVLYIFDSDMKRLGKVTGFAKNEHIEAVRFIGNMAYVITYHQTDPLFVIDLTDESNPTICGSVKITGFSTLLVPVNQKELLGIGYSTGQSKWGETRDGIKLVDFSIANPKKPKIADSKVIRLADSQVQEDHRVLVANKAKGYYAFPYTKFYWEDKHGKLFKSGVYVFNLKKGKIKLKKDYHSNKEISRCLAIGNRLYVIYENDKIGSFRP